MALGIIDSIMVGKISYQHLAAAALVNGVMNIPFVLGFGMTMSVSQTVSMANGRKDSLKVSHYFYNGLWLCTVFAIIIALALNFSKNILFHLGQDVEVARLGVPYLQIMGWSIIPMMMFIGIKQFSDGLERTRTAMMLSLAALPINIFINWLVVYGNWGFPRLELVGAAYGTLITRLHSHLQAAGYTDMQQLFNSVQLQVPLVFSNGHVPAKKRVGKNNRYKN